ncbi:MAG: 4'-phosphopantetheinyl transferase superfamily protein [Bacteroidota bacterium]
MIHILYAFLSRKDYEISLQNQLALFSNQFQKKIIQYRRWQDVQASVYGRLLLMRGVADHYRIQFKGEQILYDKNGRPFIKGVPLDFNITHSGNLVLCAISGTQRVGIDVEEINDIQFEDFHEQMTPCEYEKISSSPNKPRAFYDYWTQKEAVLKANGEGLGIPLKSFEVIEGKARLYSDVWNLTPLEIHPNYSCHLASDKKSDFVIIPVKEMGI